jgi:UDPglucose--hexose-1-phosphate uridylyltransferase
VSHYRYSKLKDNWVIVSPKRVRRPSDFELSSSEAYDVDSPFIYGNEHKTPSEIYAIREYGSKKDTPGWKVRVVPNKYNALEIEKSPLTDFDGIFEKMDGFGAHEIIIDTPKFPSKFQDLSPEEVANVFKAAKDRMADLQKDTRIKYINIFKNQGPLAGASISHPHTQIIGMPFIPKNILLEIEQCRKHFETTSRCLFSDIIKSELKSKERIVEESDNFVTYCPYASFWPFETIVGAKTHGKDFATLNDALLLELAKMTLSALKRINMALKDVSYNIFLKTVPPKRDGVNPNFYYKLDEFYQWHIEIVPRIPVIGGFELSSGVFINTVAPEESAKFLRSLVAF